MLTIPQFAAAVPCSIMTAKTWHEHIVAAMERWGIDTAHRQAGFIAQMAHESRSFGRFEEDLNYSAQRLMKVWPRRFPSLASTSFYAFKPENLANHVYGGRLGNGDYNSGDGWKYRGRGPKQITGKANYAECGEALGLPLVEQPELLLDPQHGAQAAGWYWASRGCNELMDANDYEGVTRKINGGLIGHEDGNDSGVDDRVEHHQLALRVLTGA